MPTLHWMKSLLLIVRCSTTIYALQNHRHKQDKNLCNYTEWKLVEVNITKNVPDVLQKGTGEKKVVSVAVEIDRTYYLNKSFVDEDCCEGFERRRKKEKCKRCKHKTYGRNCSKVCNCDGCGKCNHKTGKCDKCEDPISALTTTTTWAPSTYSDINSTTFENDEVSRERKQNNNIKSVLSVSATLGIIILMLVIVIAWRESYHRKHKRRNDNTQASVAVYEVPGRPLYDLLHPDTNQDDAIGTDCLSHHSECQRQRPNDECTVDEAGLFIVLNANAYGNIENQYQTVD